MPIKIKDGHSVRHPLVIFMRALFDVIGVLVNIGFGARFLLFFAGTEGAASVRMQTRICELRW
jgi:hypothetical protein